MSRRDTHHDAMLRNLGAAYYQTTQGKAKAGDVTRALESVAAEDSRRRANGAVAQGAGHPVRGHHHGRWRAGDVMTTQVVTVSKTTRYKDVVRLMTEHKVNALPVITDKRRVIGMVSEADVLRKQEQNFRRFGTGLPRRTHQVLEKFGPAAPAG